MNYRMGSLVASVIKSHNSFHKSDSMVGRSGQPSSLAVS